MLTNSIVDLFPVLLAKNKPYFFEADSPIFPFSRMSQIQTSKTKGGMAESIHDSITRLRLRQSGKHQRYIAVAMTKKNVVSQQGDDQHNMSHLMLWGILAKGERMKIGAEQDQGRAVEGEAEATRDMVVTLVSL